MSRMLDAFVSGTLDFKAPYNRVETRYRLRLVLDAIHRKNRVEVFKLVLQNPLKSDDDEGFKRLQDRIKLIDPSIELKNNSSGAAKSFEDFYNRYVQSFGVPGTKECEQRVKEYFDKKGKK